MRVTAGSEKRRAIGGRATDTSLWRQAMKDSGHRVSLERTMIVYFLLVDVACVLLGMEFAADIEGAPLKAALTKNMDRYCEEKIAVPEVLAPLDRLRNKALLMVAVILVVVVVVLALFVKRITGPLSQIIRTARAVSEGDLSRTVETEAKNELSELAGVLNDLTSNVQELLLAARNLKETGDRLAVGVQNASRGDFCGKAVSELSEPLSEWTGQSENLARFLEGFSFYSLAGKLE